MNKEEFDAYLENRYYDQMKWYSSRARSNQRTYKRLQKTLIISSALTPILIGIDFSTPYGRWLAITVSFIVVVSTSLLTTFKYHGKWINYRTTSETLKKEIHYYDAKIHDYVNSEDPEALFVQRVENLISRENTLWLISEKRIEKPSEETKSV